MEHYPCDPNIECPLRDTIGCFEDVHHEYWPKRAYRSNIEKQFRELDENKEKTCRHRHNEIHATDMPPEKPTREEILRAIGLTSLKETA